ncbi:trypsin-like serine protease [Vibrio sp. TMPB1044]|uniref:trypsin-like serine protease n=1 Tax=unclassified Vibrio TaxID=2614977 RepID=UPI0011B60D96|nr:MULTISPECIES: trypsin-like serine protease [unclassified Vibrio]MDL5027851.1 trypsin-like serine protease [Vibrio sp. TMPB1044]MDN5207979.1 trypsin-like serine protease [Vibrio sp. TMPB1044]
MKVIQTKWLPLSIYAVGLSSMPVLADISPQIINGNEATKGSWPFMVALVSKNMDAYEGQFCGASFIGERYVLTAAHCIEASSNQDFEVVIGVSDLSSPDVEQHRYSVEQIYTHENYTQEPASNDIAIIELSDRPTKSAVNLVDGHVRDNLNAGQMLTVIGWGDQNSSEEQYSSTSKLNQVNVPLVSQRECNLGQGDGYSDIGSDAFCAGYKEGGRDSCNGDSGGPIMLYTNGNYEQLGLVSWGEGCAQPNAFGVYTNISHFADWIDKKTAGFSYQTKVMLGAQPLGLLEHKFEFTNKSDQEINVTNVSLAVGTNDPITYNGSAIIKSNSCMTLSPNESCEVAVSYNIDSVGNHGFGVKLSTDSLVDVVTSKAYAIGANEVSDTVNVLVTLPKNGVYSTEAWDVEGNTIASPDIGNGQSTAFIVEGIPTGTVSLDLTVFSEEEHDYMEIYINGFEVGAFAGQLSGTVELPMARAKDNSFMIAYSKDEVGAAGHDRVTIKNFAYTDEIKELSLTEDPIIKKTGGSLGWYWLVMLLGGAMRRKSFSLFKREGSQ